MQYILSIDQGTTGTTAIIWDEESRLVARANLEHKQFYPQPGWVEHDAEEIWQNVLKAARLALGEAKLQPAQLAAMGITNQRETVVFWDKHSGKPLAPAIVWQCRRTAALCRELKDEGYEELVRSKTGLLLDPYFSGSKIKWALENLPAVKSAAQKGRLFCGTVDSYLLFRLTGGKVFATDYSNASRTLLYNINTLAWDEELLKLFDVPQDLLPQVCPSSTIFGAISPELFSAASLPVGGMAGDQQAALFGQACFRPGMTKNTYGTGSFLLMNTGKKAVSSKKGLLTTIAWGLEDEVSYALEGSIFITGAAVQWLRDGLKLIGAYSELEALALEVQDSGGVYFVPAFVGLGAPHWDPYARGLIIGLTGGSSKAHLARAVIEAMAYQTNDVLGLMRAEAGLKVEELRVDGGASAMNLLLQFQADLAQTVVRRPEVSDTTALGAAYLAGLASGVWKGLEDLAQTWQESRAFYPTMDDQVRQACCAGWDEAVRRSLGWAKP